MTLRVAHDDLGHPDNATVSCDGCGISATAFGAVASATDLAVEDTFIAGGLGVTECPMVPGTHWCAACEGPRRAAAAEAVPF